MPFYYTTDFTETPYKYSASDDVKFQDLVFAVLLIDDFTGKESEGNIRLLMKEGEDEEIKNGEVGVKRAYKNNSGYYFFKTSKNYSDKIPDRYTVKVESDLYFPVERENVILSELRKLDLKFSVKGPKAGEISSNLEDVSQLDEDDIVEFNNPAGMKETRKITGIEKDKKTIFWKEELETDFSADNSTIIAVRDPVKKLVLRPKPSYPFPDNVTLIRGRVKGIEPSKPPIIRVAGRIETVTDDRGEFVLYLKEGTYLFNWRNIPGKDDWRLIRFLKYKYSIDGLDTPQLDRIDENTIKISNENHNLLLELDSKKTSMNLRIDDGRTDELIARTENERLNIYEKITVVEIIKPDKEPKKIEVTIKEEYEKISLGVISFP